MYDTLTSGTRGIIGRGPDIPDIIHQLRTRGFASLGSLFSDAEVQRWVELFDHDRSRFADCWRIFAGGQGITITTDPLVTSPGFDGLIRHPGILGAMRGILGGEERFCEITCRHVAAGAAGVDGRPDWWHRDFPHDLAHPLRIESVQAMVYLTDVGPDTHCFALSPESVDEPILEPDAQLARDGVHECHGPAGTVVLFNTSVLHTARIRGHLERKSVHTYYARHSRELMTTHSVVPSRLWDESANAETRAFYGARLSDRTRLYAAAFGRA